MIRGVLVSQALRSIAEHDQWDELLERQSRLRDHFMTTMFDWRLLAL